jgi:transcription-repair coupling factor (superfamily II helicase)
LSLYTRLDNCDTEEELQQFYKELEDRFGPVPPPVQDLFDTVRVRKMAVLLGFEKMLLKDQTLRCYFINKPDSPYFESEIFHAILQYIQTQTNKARLKQTGKLFLLVIEDIKDMQQMLRVLQRMKQAVLPG